jgi:hypothetical protein
MNVSFYWSDDTLIETINDVANDTNASTTISLDITYNTLYSWYAIANDSTATNTSDTFNFTTLTNVTPNKPTCISPTHNQTSVKIDTTLKVHITDNEGDSMSVDFYYSDHTLIQHFDNQANDTDVETSALSLRYKTKYNWYVIVNDSYSENTSDTFSFTTSTYKEDFIYRHGFDGVDLIFMIIASIMLMLFLYAMIYSSDLDLKTIIYLIIIMVMVLSLMGAIVSL